MVLKFGTNEGGPRPGPCYYQCYYWIRTLWVLSVLMAVCGIADASAYEGYQDRTSLMFVGEKTDMLAIASKREESAWDAPAVALVIDREDVSEKGYGTLAEALSGVSGFHMAGKEWGTQPYLRGIADSVLFLYDTVPLGSELSKSFNYLDKNLSLASIRKIEIIKGPGSVLWGPDAFAGIVNVVPLTGKDLHGAETGVLTGFTGDRNGAYVNLGTSSENGMAGFLSVSARRWDETEWTDRFFLYGWKASRIPLFRCLEAIFLSQKPPKTMLLI